MRAFSRRLFSSIVPPIHSMTKHSLKASELNSELRPIYSAMFHKVPDLTNRFHDSELTFLLYH